MRTAGLIVLAIWLIAYGLDVLVDLNFANKHVILAGMQILAACLLIIDALQTRVRELGLAVLALWLVLSGVMAIMGYGHQALILIRSALAILSGLLILFRR